MAAAHPRCVWLDGGGSREWSGRRSLIGWLEPSDVSLTYSAARREVTRHCDGRSEIVGSDVWEVLSAELAAGSPEDEWFGYFGYACRPDLPAAVAEDPAAAVPDAVWMRPSQVRLFEQLPREVLNLRGCTTPREFRSTRSTGYSCPAPPTYTTAFDQVQEQLRAGNTYEANLTYRLTRAPDVPPADTPVGGERRQVPAEVYRRLRAINPAPYAGFLQHDVPGAEAWLLSSSPERYALVTADRTIETRPIKGTTQRGGTPEEDEHNAERLRTDPKFRSENLMIVDLLRNDLSLVCEPGTVEVPELMAVESYPSVHQLVSTVRGRLRGDVGTVEALRALFPPGSMTGAPKLRTMQIIAEVEDSPRGAYAGAFGRISADGSADLGVVIRTLTSTGDGRWTLGTGGGITVRSELAEEYAETRWKADRLLRAIRPEE